MVAQIRLAGEHWIERHGRVTGIKDSTILQPDGISGDYQLSANWAADPEFDATWLTAKTPCELLEGGNPVWGGVLDEARPSEDGSWALRATGWATLMATRPAIELSAGNPIPSRTPNTAFDYAIAHQGLPLTRGANSLGATAVSADASTFFTLDQLLLKQAQNVGKYLWVNTGAIVSLVSRSTAVAYLTTPNDFVFGTADPRFYSHIYYWYVSAVDPTTGDPTAYGLKVVSNAETAAKFGFSGYLEDATSLGLIGSSQALANAQGLLGQIGGRVQFVDRVLLSDRNLIHPGFGGGSPMDVRANDLLAVPGTHDRRSSATTMAMTMLLGGVVEHDRDSGEATFTPLDYAARDVDSILQTLGQVAAGAA